MNEDAKKREGSKEDMGCDVNFGCMSDDKKYNEDDEVAEQSVGGTDEGIKLNNSQVTTKEGNSEKKVGYDGRKSFVAAISKNSLECDRNLECIPTEINENGIEVVVFDDVMVAEGSKRWDLTLCGYFVGYRCLLMS
nr:RNA-directed DNA polymerase, eukaryota, reverse transcriptase zinc-binding domain protein [Tanacetum cinerariifolium]